MQNLKGRGVVSGGGDTEMDNTVFAFKETQFRSQYCTKYLRI